MGPGDLRDLMTGIAFGDAPFVLVGTETGDDAGVVCLNEELALVTSADYITPPLDDPQLYGEIAAANALSDIYAMGGRPVAALNICLFPAEIELAVLREILQGAASKVREAGACIVGGHTTRGQELLYGLSVTGTVHPRRIRRNIGAQPGDVLILTKPLGTGLLISGYRRGLVSAAQMAQVASGMASLNRTAAEVLEPRQVHAATDVTGFGLLGHALGMARSGVTLHLELQRLPLYPGALELAERGVTCSGARANRAAYAGQWVGQVSPALEEVLHDPQTSGGLLLALSPEEAAVALPELSAAGVAAVQIGWVSHGPPQIVLHP
ncbi:MAG: selenide, water dikinase SelD [Myxococcales bacterium]|nr:selenide, water dikinase SelD [Myxococcota bacterium]MDW8280636.1 selenide, water dikinase SelD [Myxococcales bacterium]